MTKAEFIKLCNGEVPEENKAIIEGALYIPIGRLENILDTLNWSTSNFQYQIFKDGYANLCVAASLELEINYSATGNHVISRVFVGACNFSISSLEPNTHFLATAKSECIKNAASDIGKYFGRGLNDGLVPSPKPIERKTVKANADSKIMQQFKEAVEKGDTAAQILLSNIYDIKYENHVEEKQNIGS